MFDQILKKKRVGNFRIDFGREKNFGLRDFALITDINCRPRDKLVTCGIGNLSLKERFFSPNKKKYS